jgi:hypothetical protein
MTERQEHILVWAIGIVCAAITVFSAVTSLMVC